MKTCGRIILGAILPGLFTTLSAAALSGTFNLSGILTATTTANTWNSDQAPNLSQMFTLSGGTGSFATENGQDMIDNMNNTTEPVGSTFTPQPFISFLVVPGLPVLDVNFIAAGIGGTAGCSASPAVTTPPQTCTPACYRRIALHVHQQSSAHSDSVFRRICFHWRNQRRPQHVAWRLHVAVRNTVPECTRRFCSGRIGKRHQHLFRDHYRNAQRDHSRACGGNHVGFRFGAAASIAQAEEVRPSADAVAP